MESIFSIFIITCRGIHVKFTFHLYLLNGIRLTSVYPVKYVIRQKIPKLQQNIIAVNKLLLIAFFNLDIYLPINHTFDAKNNIYTGFVRNDIAMPERA